MFGRSKSSEGGVTPARKWRRRAVIAAVAVSIYAILGFLVVPRVIHSQLANLSREYLHREATIAQVRFNPFTLRTDLTQLQIKDRDGADLLSLDRLTVNLQVLGILRRAYRLREVEVDRLHLTARILADGKPSIADLFEPPPSEPPRGSSPSVRPVASRDRKPMARAIVDHLVMRDGRIDFIDESRTPRFMETLSPLDLDVRDLSTIPREGGEHVITIGIGERTRLRWSGRQIVDPLRFEGRLELSEISLPRVWSYAEPESALEVKEGSADVAWSYEITRADGGDFAVALKDGSISLNGLSVRPRGGAEDWLTLPSVDIRPILAAWPESKIEIGGVKLTEPRALVRIAEDGRTNWETALAKSAGGTAQAPEPSPAPPDVPARPWTGKVAAIEIAGGTIHFEDLSVSPSVSSDLGEIGLQAENLSENLAAPFPARLSAKLDESGRLSISGTIVPSPFGAELEVSSEKLDLAPFRTYAAVSNAALRKGIASISGKVHVGPGAPRVRFEGEVSVDGLEVVDPAAAQLLAWGGCRAKGIRLTFAPERLHIGDVSLAQAFVKIAIDREGNLNLARLGSTSETPAEPSGEALPVDITRVTLNDAKIEYADESLVLPFGTNVYSAKGTIKDLSTSSAAPARLDIEGRVPDTGFVKAGGTLRVAEPFASSDVSVTFRDVAMPALTPYFAQFAGYAVKDGTLDLDIRYRIENHHLVGDHRLVANQLVLGDKVEGTEAGFPVRLAIALLKDKNGRIDLDVPIEGAVDSPEFSYNRIFWQAVRKILANVAAAPFRAIGKLFGKDDEDLDLVGFASGRSDLLPPEQEILSKIASELAGRPGVTVSVEGRYDPVADTEALKKANLEQRIDAKRATVESLETIMEALFAETFSAERLQAEKAKFTAPAAPAAPASNGAPAAPAPAAFNAAGYYDSLRSQLLAAVEVGPADLTGLAGARAQAVVSALNAGGLELSRVKAADPAAVKRKKRGSDLVASEMTMSVED